MTITAKVVADSISKEGVRLTTLQLRYPRMVHADFMTHRVFSRNGRSSRAVPFKTLVKEAPYIPHFMLNQGGMVATQELDDDDYAMAHTIWLEAVEACKRAATELSELGGGKGVHKQWVNRMLEWFGYIDVLVSSTDWANFIELRDDVGAQPEIIELAKQIQIAMRDSSPVLMQPGAWHMPYIDIDTIMEVRNLVEPKHPKWQLRHGAESTNAQFQLDCLDILRKISVARCARLTIKPFDGDGSIDKELKRYDLLMVSKPVHASPAEHIATPDVPAEYGFSLDFPSIASWENQHEHGNFYGWRQFRKMIPDNTIYDR
jgi:thymidylate synthase ThyX